MSAEQGNKRFKNRRSRVLWRSPSWWCWCISSAPNKLITEKAQSTPHLYRAKSMGEE